MADAKTTVTELLTGLGMAYPTAAIDTAMDRPMPREFINVDEDEWRRVVELRRSGRHTSQFEAAFRNGQWFAASADGLAGRSPGQIEWKGSHRAPGDEVIPADLRIDRVWLVSCKYLSKNIHNVAPARLFQHLLMTIDSHDGSDWYYATAPRAFQALYEAVREVREIPNLPSDVGDLTGTDRQRMKAALSELSRKPLPEPAHSAYQELITAVSRASADRWRAQLGSLARQERMLWRLLRLCSAPYFILGSTSADFLRLRIDTPWDWRQQFRFHELRVEPSSVG